MPTPFTDRRTTSWGRKLIGVTVATALTMSVSVHASAQENTTPTPAAAVAETSPDRLTEPELNERGLTRQDAEQATQAYVDAIEQAQRQGDISASEATQLLTLAEPAGEEPGGVSTQALPVWAAAAIVGCAAGAVVGEGKAQIKNALKNGASVDEATDIAVGAAVDCVFGAVPGGVVAAAAKKALTTPIKAALKPLIKKSVDDMSKE